jgi:site-specific recombinase XerD
MGKQFLDRLTGENLVRVDSLKALTQGYILSCRCEGKSPKTIRFYGDNLGHFIWWLEKQGYSDDPTQISPNYIRAFLAYVGTEPIRWGATSTTACRPASPITVRHYYRVLFTFFKWLQQEELVSDNPVAHLRTPKIEQRAIQALIPKEVELLLNCCPPKTLLGCRYDTPG